MPLNKALMTYFCRVYITQRNVTRVVLLFCHIRKEEPPTGIQQCCLREIKNAGLRHFYHDRFTKALCPTHKSERLSFRVGSNSYIQVPMGYEVECLDYRGFASLISSYKSTNYLQTAY